jgi:hypothetical protein
MSEELLCDWAIFHKLDKNLTAKLFSQRQQDYLILLDHIFEIFMQTFPIPTDIIH